MAGVRIPSEHGFSPLCGSYGVLVRAKAKSRLDESASMEVLYDEFVDNEHTAHSAVVPWNGADVELGYIEGLLTLANVPRNIVEDNAVDMVLCCVKGILQDPQRPQYCSVYIEVMSDKETAAFSEDDQEEEKDHEEEEEHLIS